MNYFTTFLFCCIIILTQGLHAQNAADIRRQIDTLCSENFQGRGYVGDGVNKAGDYIARQYAVMGLKPLKDDDYFQYFTLSVNTFPGAVEAKYRCKTRKPGVGYLIDAYSPGVHNMQGKTKVFSLNEIATEEAWNAFTRTLNDRKRIYVLNDVDSLQKRLSWRPRQIAASLPEGIFIFPKKSKPLWWPGTGVNQATVVYWFDSTLSLRNNRRFRLNVAQQFIPEMQCKNVIGIVPGAISDSFIVFTAHYDHLGKMGTEAMFPGASDNASGTAMMLSLAGYYTQHPQRYNMVFIAFAGEETGLTGSEYFVKNPLFDLQKIRFLINIDIMGDATNGISVVNGTQHEKEYDMLRQLNPIVASTQTDTTFLFREIRKGGSAANSDHHHFSEAGVPAFFIFSLGGKGFYHDTWDKPETLSLKNIPAVRQLLIDFVNKLSSGDN